MITTSDYGNGPVAHYVSPKVLIVDDEELICWSIKERLLDAGFVSYSAQTLDETQALLEKYHFTHLITDLKLIGCTGFDIIDLVRSKSPDVHVVMITAFGDEQSQDKAIDMGVELFQEKPVDIEDTLAYLHSTS